MKMDDFMKISDIVWPLGMGLMFEKNGVKFLVLSSLLA